MFYKIKIVIMLILLTALSSVASADIDSLSEEELYSRLQAALPVIDQSDCVIKPEQKDRNYIYIYNLKSRIVNLHPEWSASVIDAILNSDVEIGMTKEQVQASRGLPKDVVVSIENSGIREKWHYGGSRYLYFENGKFAGSKDK